jgi:DNA-binding XRE family transcriptional regulator
MDARDDESDVMRRFYRARSLVALGQAVASARRARGVTQDVLAQAIGSSRPTISRIERGTPATTDVVVDALARCGYELVVVPRGATITVTP